MGQSEGRSGGDRQRDSDWKQEGGKTQQAEKRGQHLDTEEEAEKCTKTIKIQSTNPYPKPDPESGNRRRQLWDEIHKMIKNTNNQLISIARVLIP